MAHIKNRESMDYHAYRHISSALSEYCDFHVVFRLVVYLFLKHVSTMLFTSIWTFLSPAHEFSIPSASTLMFQSLKVGTIYKCKIIVFTRLVISYLCQGVIATTVKL